MNKVSRFLSRRYVAVVGAVSSVSVSVPAFAQAATSTAPDYTAITSAIDWSTTITAILAIMATMAAVYIAFKGGKMVLRALKSA